MVRQPAGHRRADRIAPQEKQPDRSHADVGHSHLGAEQRKEAGGRRPIAVVQSRAAEQQRDQLPFVGHGPTYVFTASDAIMTRRYWSKSLGNNANELENTGL